MENLRKIKHFINNEFVATANTGWFETLNPANLRDQPSNRHGFIQARDNDCAFCRPVHISSTAQHSSDCTRKMPGNYFGSSLKSSLSGESGSAFAHAARARADAVTRRAINDVVRDDG